ncbi:MAG TPA: family 43 glycosylhydrolase, partial [Niabella sp.]|nr:family 43 glycosylhydrolase [Niabella sp.]
MKKYISRCLVGIAAIVTLGHCSKAKKDKTIDEGVPGRPQIRLVQPAIAVPGDTVTITGANFGTNTGQLAVLFDNQDAAVVTVADNQVKVVVPSPAESQMVKVRVKLGDQPSNLYLFTIDYPQPTIAAYPLKAAAGDTIEIAGSGFGNKKNDVAVHFNGKTATVIAVTGQKIQLIVPEYAGKKDGDIQVAVRQKTSGTVPFSYINIHYSNPVVSRSLPDPTVIKSADGWFYLYATEDTRNIPIMRSQNLFEWTQTGTAFTDATRPDFEPNGGLWAPSIHYIKGKYVLYYSMSVWGGEWTCGIGVATADKPGGPFTDKGKLFRSNEIDVQNSIDPYFIEDNGKKYLFWGSFRGIYMIEMSDDGLSIKPGATKQQVAGTYFEGVYIYKKANYYYMFASIGSCCAGLNSTYQLVVGRSANLTG